MFGFTEQRHIQNVKEIQRKRDEKEERERERTCVAFITVKQRHHKISLHLVSTRFFVLYNPSTFATMQCTIVCVVSVTHSWKMQTEQIKEVNKNTRQPEFINLKLISFYLFCQSSSVTTFCAPHSSSAVLWDAAMLNDTTPLHRIDAHRHRTINSNLACRMCAFNVSMQCIFIHSFISSFKLP